MASAATIQTIGRWDSKVGVPLSDAIAVTQDVFKKSASKVCWAALWGMTQSASVETPVGQKRREVTDNPAFMHYLKTGDGPGTYKQARRDGKDMRHYFRWTALRMRQNGRVHIYGNEKEPLAEIKRRGLAKKSWFWGWGKENKTNIPGVTTVSSIVSDAAKQAGYVLRNKLSYITKILSAGWEKRVETKAGNRLMAQARNRLHQEWARRMNSLRKAA